MNKKYNKFKAPGSYLTYALFSLAAILLVSNAQAQNSSATLDFENGLNGWSQASNDSHNWTITSGGTPSNNTGPSSAAQGSQYAFVEVSSASGGAFNSGNNAILNSPSLTSGTYTVSFQYHMLGTQIGTLYVDALVNGSWQEIWNRQGSQGNSWQQGSVDTSAGATRVRFRMVAAGGWRGDIAIDDIDVSGSSSGGSSSGGSSSGGSSSSGSSGGNSCPASHPVYSSSCDQCFTDNAQASAAGCQVDGGGSSSGGSSSGGSSSGGSSSGGSSSGGSSSGGGTTMLESLDFENGVDNWIQVSGSDTHDWTITSGGTPSNNTGPTSAQQGSQYAFIETSNAGGGAFNSGNNARLNSPDISGSNRQLSFFYNMRGGNIGTLYVDVNEDSTGWVNDIWSRTGSQGAAWVQGNVDLSNYTGTIKVRFRAVAAGGWQGDIAIDNIQVTGDASGGSSSGGSTSGGSSSGGSSSGGTSSGGSSSGGSSSGGSSSGGTSSGGSSSGGSSSGGSGVSGKFVPSDGRTLMIIGQDLASVTNYVNSNNFPTPSGVTTYIAFYDILNSGAGFGAIGVDNNITPVGSQGDLDWGGGPLNAHSAAVGWPESTLQIGLNMAEGNNGNFWCQGCLAQIGSGQRDNEIIKMANFFKSIDTTPVYLRIGYEFDGTWNDGYSNRQNYINAYRRIVDILRQENVTNVAYVWQSSASPIDDILEGSRENIADWYPGDNYVDWVALSWFLLPNENPPVGGNPATQLSLADEVVNFGRNKGKPVMIAESTPQGYDIGTGQNCNISPVWDGDSGQGCVGKSASQIWNEWFVPFFTYIRDNDDVIKAVSYINADWDTQGLWAPPYSQGFWGDTRVEANGTITNNWNNELNDTGFWINGSSSLFQSLGL